MHLPSTFKKLRPVYEHSCLWRTPARIVKVAAGRGSGKTELSLRRLALHMRLKNKMVFFAAPTLPQAKRLAWDKLISMIPPQWFKGGSPAEGIKISEMKLVSKFGSEIHVVGMDKPQRIEGNQWDGGVVDESSDQKPTIMRSIMPALTHKNGWLWRIGVPKRTGIGAKSFKEAFDEGTLNYDSFMWPSRKILTPAQLAEARKHLSEKDFNEQFNASWETAAGAIYYGFEDKLTVRSCAYRPDKLLVVGSDFNVDPMSWTLGHIYQDDSDFTKTYVEIFDEIRLKDTNTPATLTYLHNRYKTHRGGWCFYGDAAGKQRHTNAAYSDYQLIKDDKRFDITIDNRKKQKRIRYPSKNPLLKDRFAATNMMLCNADGERRLFVDPRCKYLLDDLRHRSYAEGTMEPDDGPGQGHMADALDYILHAEFRTGWDAGATNKVEVLTR